MGLSIRVSNRYGLARAAQVGRIRSRMVGGAAGAGAVAGGTSSPATCSEDGEGTSEVHDDVS